jgi:hypothetical protein
VVGERGPHGLPAADSMHPTTGVADAIPKYSLTNPKPFIWTATTEEILAKVRIVQTNIKRLVDNNAK